jgi:hypothetical protein
LATELELLVPVRSELLKTRRCRRYSRHIPMASKAEQDNHEDDPTVTPFYCKEAQYIQMYLVCSFPATHVCADESPSCRGASLHDIDVPFDLPCTCCDGMSAFVWLPFTWDLEERKLCTFRFTRKTRWPQRMTEQAGKSQRLHRSDASLEEHAPPCRMCKIMKIGSDVSVMAFEHSIKH